ncbi:ferredoxin--NADP reductase [Thalassotalea mangrovi]|uniref:ferredoxin--NADP(+) reductase n=1 Tax=Thalassotalea mangrovi TaxID=2572245 RepID=A0A4U1B502_9GAMM|nr:ferredoxin--NADP reductase [Thalassotalea mangrovi]TKB44637.1 ferredoxin--NADP reductase [Thalassotalea mangrovi]
MQDRFVTGKVVQVTQFTGGCFAIKVQAPLPPYYAGQFTKLGLMIDGKLVSRAYSFINHPSDKFQEFYLVEVADGLLSPRLKALNTGDDIYLYKNANGLITHQRLPDADNLWFWVTGTGVGIALSLLKDPQIRQKYKEFVVLHGVSDAGKIHYLSELSQMGENVHYYPVLSRETNPDYLHGRITHFYQELETQIPQQLTPETSHIILCGNPAMITDANTLLSEHGFRKHRTREPGHITMERYW